MKNIKNIKKRKMGGRKKGYIAILAVLVLLSVTGSLAAALVMLSIGSNQSVEALRRGEQALFFSESCAEEALLQIARDPDYASGNFRLPEGECGVSVEKDGMDYAIRAVGNGENYKRSLIVEVTLGDSEINATSWKEE